MSTEITITEVERFGRTVYEIKRGRLPFSLGRNGYATAAELEAWRTVAEQLPDGFDVSFFQSSKAHSVLSSGPRWIIYRGDRKIRSVDSIAEIVPAALTEAERPAPAATPAPQVAPAPKPAAKKPRRIGTCQECGRHGVALYEAHDMSGIAGRVCANCSRDKHLSFA